MVLQDEIIVDFSLPINKVYTVVQQYDKNSRKVVMQLKNKNQILKIWGESVGFRYHKQDNTDCLLDCEIVDAERGLVSVLFDENMCMADGISQAQVFLYKDDVVLHSTMIRIRVAESLNEKEIVSSDDFSIFNELLELKEYLNDGSVFLTIVSNTEPTEDKYSVEWIQPIT